MSNTKFNSKIPPVSYKNLDPTRLSFTKLEKNERNKTQKVSFARYRHDNGETSLIFQTPKIKLTQHGIPTLGEFYKKDQDRQFIKLPYDTNQPEALELKTKLQEIDAMLEDVSTKGEILGRHADKYIYSSLVKTPQDHVLIDEDDDDYKDTKKRKPKEKYNYTKAKFDIDFNTKELNTVVYKTLGEVESREKGKKREQVDIKTMDQLANFVKFNSTVRLLIMVNKLWAATTADKSGKLSYGLGLKVIQIEVEPSEGKNSVKENFKEDSFIDDDDDDIPTSTNATNPIDNTGK